MKSWGKPTLYLHIGPMKTATTTIQKFFFDVCRDKSNNCSWPSFHSSWDHTHLLAQSLLKTDIKSRKVINATREYLSNAARNNEKIILTSELFSFTPPDGVSQLNDILKDFEVTVVITYRESLSRIISYYTQELKYVGYVGLFGFEKYLQDKFPDFLYHEDEYIFKYSKVFGIQNFIIIDYEGISAAGKDIRYVFACDIMKFACDDKKIYKQFISVSNESNEHEITKNEIIDLLFAYFLLQGCDINEKSRIYRPQNSYKLNNKWPKVIDDSIKVRFRIEVDKFKWPVIQFKLLNESYFQHYSEQSIRYDERFRYLYNANLLFGNRTANMKMAKSIYFKTIDRSFLLSDPLWMEKMNTFFIQTRDKFCKVTGANATHIDTEHQ